MKKFFLVAASLVFVLGGCGVPRTSTPPAEPPRQVEQPPKKVDAIIHPVLEDPSSGEFEATRKKLLERGILKDTTPVYRADQVVGDGERYVLDRFFWEKDRIIVILRFFGEEWKYYDAHRVRLIVDNKEHITSLLVSREMKDGYVMSYHFAHAGIPEPGVYNNYVVVFVRLRISPDEETQRRRGPRRPEAMDGDTAFILTLEDMVIRR